MAKLRRNKGGRIRKDGERFPCGKLRPAIDRGSDRVIELRAVFRPFHQGKGDQWTGTPIGRAWLVGLLDGFEVDSAAIRDAGLGYAERYWGYYPSPSSVANYEAQDRRGSGWGDGSDPRGERFRSLDRAIMDAGRAAYEAAQGLVIDHHWFPDENPAWLDRLINERLLRSGRPVAGELPRSGDVDKLKLAIEGLLTIVAGKRERKAA
jgi:hypothetical protein